MEEQIPLHVMDERLQRLNDRINNHRTAFNRATVGTDTQVLIERAGKHSGQMIGRSPWLQSVHVDTDAKPGDIIDVTVVAATSNSLTGAVQERVAS
jgi:tRNA-2-methylthio-N6-dimethylallyladenosine synthase